MKGELLAPAGDERAAYAALGAGADAIYLGLGEFSARAGAENFDVAGLARTAERAHLLGAKVYVALNTLVKDPETESFFRLAAEAYRAGADAILVQDLFLGRELKSLYPEIALHLSTQAGCCNELGARLAKEYGFSRVVLARETPIAEIARVSEIVETECFVQGALCTCFSGQCYFSSFAGNNSGNRGRCKQPCRKLYSIDRKGYEEPSYALSPSDLRMGERIAELGNAGVYSFKIEGRMRRPEYVAAAVRYYRALLDGREADPTDLVRAYNRGDYTFGLGFGQGKDFLSRKTQGHIGERIGTVSLRGGRPVCVCDYRARTGDGFKILRRGREVGGAAFSGECAGGFFLSSGSRLAAGDEVRLTTDSSAGGRLFREPRREIAVSLDFRAGSPAHMRCGAYEFESERPLERANSAPLSRDDLISCFDKNDGLFSVRYENIVHDNAFMPKSELNALRRKFYEGLVKFLVPPCELPERRPRELSLSLAHNGRSAVISAEPDGCADVLVYKPGDYSAIGLPAVRAREIFLYLPPFFTSSEIAAAREKIALFDGIYAEGYYGVLLAKEWNVPLFAGTGFNLTNRYAVERCFAAGAKYVALSKEISQKEQAALAAENVFALCRGGIKLMDLCYCPFERTCEACDRRERYAVTDGDGRRFPLRRYRAGGCRFELYNCAALLADSGPCGALADDTIPAGEFRGTTKGHSGRSFL